MHLSAFAARQIDTGRVVDATSKTHGQVKQLVGLYVDEAHAVGSPDPAEWFKLHSLTSH